jgi:hypothetical protein
MNFSFPMRAAVGAGTVERDEVVLAVMGHDEVEFAAGLDDRGGGASRAEQGGLVQVEHGRVAVVADARVRDFGSRATEREHADKPQGSPDELAAIHAVAAGTCALGGFWWHRETSLRPARRRHNRLSSPPALEYRGSSGL